jgi:hypothetical protein
MLGISPERRKSMQPDERIVVDWYRNYIGVTEGRNRITTDPADQGRKCTVGGYLLDVIEEIHQSCSHREQPGYCRICKDTPVAEKKVSDSPISSEDGSIPRPTEVTVPDDVDV